MSLALSTAKEVKKDIPISALIVKNNEIISIATNKREENNQTIAHAEILAINEANKKLNSWRLDECDMYVTLEPCPMCAWAILNARIKNLYFGAYDLKTGAAQSVLSLFEYRFNHLVNFTGGIMQEECSTIIKDFFRQLRKKSLD